MPIMKVKVGKARDVEQKQSFVETIGQLASSCINKSLEKDMENKKLADLQFVIMIHDGAVPLHWTAVTMKNIVTAIIEHFFEALTI